MIGCYCVSAPRNHNNALCTTNWTFTPRSSQHSSPYVHTETLKVSRNDTHTESWPSAWHAELGCGAIINFYISIFHASYNSHNAHAFCTWIHHRYVILRCVYTAEFRDSICSLLLIFFHLTPSHLVSRCWSPFGKTTLYCLFDFPHQQ